MAIVHSSFVSILIIFLSVALSSAGHKIADTDIKHLCSKTSNPGVCYKLLKSDHQHTANVDAKGLAEVSVDLASNRANKIHSQFNSLAKASHDSRLKNIYNSCSKNYNDAIRDLEVAKHNLQSGAYKNVHVQVKDAAEKIKNCENEFNRAFSDRAHIRKKNQDFQFLLSIVKVMSDNLNKK